jgi:hypothetical protein
MKNIFLLSILFSSLFSFSQNIEIQSDSIRVGKYERLELAYKLTASITTKIDNFIFNRKQDRLNPYDPDQINFEAVFTSPTGIQTKRFGFYYEPFTEDETFDTWVKDTTSVPWRVRFAPNEIGNWKVEIHVHVIHSTETIQITNYFSCVPSAHKGNLTVNATEGKSNRFLSYKESGETFVTIGNNVSSGGFYTYKPSQNKRQMNGVKQLITAGGNFTRFDMQPQAALPDWPVIDNYNGKQDEMFGFDRLVDLCEKNGVYFIVFRHHVELIDSYYNPGFSDWSGVSWFDNPYRTGLSLSRKEEYLTNEEAIEWQLKSLRYVFSRWGYSPNFSFYGYSEVNHWYSGIVKDEKKEDGKYEQKDAATVFAHWFENQKEYILKNLNSNMLFSNSFSNIPSFERNANFNGMFYHSDIVALHDYGNNKDGNYKNKYEAAKHFYKAYNKPVLIEEMGVSDNKLKVYCCTGIEYHNNIWAASFMGTTGTGLDWWWDRGVHDFGYHLYLKNVTAFFVSEKLNELNFKPQKWSDSPLVDKRRIENFALVSENQERVLGWVHNATYYWRNIAVDNPCMEDLVKKSSTKYPCYVGDGFDLNTAGEGEYAAARFEDDYTLVTGTSPIISETGWKDNPKFKVSGLKSSFGIRKHWYKIEFYCTNQQGLLLNEAATQIVSSNLFSEINPNVPNLDNVNPDYAYKITYLGKFSEIPKL